MDILFRIHQGLGHLTGTVIVILLIWSIVEYVRNVEENKVFSITSSAIIGLVDLQILIGIVLYVIMPSVARPTTWHPMAMILGAVGFHISKKLEPLPRSVGYGASTVMIWLGIIIVLL
ncbi:MAG: hypothetical protein ABEJ65_07255 [bacterium]